MQCQTDINIDDESCGSYCMAEGRGGGKGYGAKGGGRGGGEGYGAKGGGRGGGEGYVQLDASYQNDDIESLQPYLPVLHMLTDYKSVRHAGCFTLSIGLIYQGMVHGVASMLSRGTAMNNDNAAVAVPGYQDATKPNLEGGVSSGMLVEVDGHSLQHVRLLLASFCQAGL